MVRMRYSSCVAGFLTISFGGLRPIICVVRQTVKPNGETGKRFGVNGVELKFTTEHSAAMSEVVQGADSLFGHISYRYQVPRVLRLREAQALQLVVSCPTEGNFEQRVDGTGEVILHN